MDSVPILVIVGPTASGKSALAVRIAKQRRGEVISADSRQVYKGLDIGTGKITRREMRGIPHHLLDVSSPRAIFTAHDFVRLGRKAIADIHKRGKLPIVCGGTGFYIDALLGRRALAETPRDEKLRARFSRKSAAQLFTLLARKDAVRAAQMDTPSERHNKARLIRALEIAYQKKGATSPPLPRYDIEWIGIDWPDDVLKKRIHKRLAARMKTGMLVEAQRLHTRGLSWKRMEELCLEYRYLSRYLRRRMSKDEMLAQLEHEIWQYAKRQRTWWRKNAEISWRIQTKRPATKR